MRISAIICCVCAALFGCAIEASADEYPDSLSTGIENDTIVENPWYMQLKEERFNINSPKINYPKFWRFAVDVYNWGDSVFNSYDPEYVVGTGKNWKVTAKSYNWMESYMLLFSPKIDDMLHLRSEIYADLGVSVSFMAVSVGYTANMNNLVNTGGDKDRKTFNFSFTCSRLFASVDYSSTKGGSKLTHFGDYNGGKHFSYDFNDINHKSFTGEVYYFFNSKRYAQAAAYCFSKYQLKSAGSWILGFSFNHQRVAMDFSNLPTDMKQYLPSLGDEYRFRYTDYSVIGGYGYNWAITPRKWLFNVTILPSVGYRHSYSDSTAGRKNMVATNLRAKMALVYNHRALFASLNGNLDAHFYFKSRYSFFNSNESLSLIVGVRF